MWTMAGQDIATFWDQTPATFNAVMRGYARRERAALDLASYQAWQAARLTGITWHSPKKFPTLDKVVSKRERAERARRPQSAEEMIAAMRAWAVRQGRVR
jgi:hypothetical protein